jgi:hypothetical protein
MLEKIICYLTGKLNETEYFQKIFPFVELIQKGDNLRPAEYLGKGQFKDVTRFDHYNGMAYFRKAGSTKTSEGDDEISEVPCSLLLKFEYPLRLVMCVPKEKLTKDDEFSDERMTNTILSVVTGEGGAIKNQLKALEVTFIPTQVITSNKDVLNDEYPGFSINDINYKYAYAAIDLTVTVQIKQSCLQTECEEAYYE